MAAKVSHFFSCISLFFFLLPFLCYAEREKASPFDFLKRLQGGQKGDKLQGLHELKHYLKSYGYLNYENQIVTDHDEFDDSLEFAIKTYQLNYHLEPTRLLDAQTVSKMMMPRCGVADISNGTNTMHPIPDPNNSSSFWSFSRYAFMGFGGSFWPPSKTNLTYSFIPLVNHPVFVWPIGQAFDKWANATRNYFKFTKIDDYAKADLKIGFYSGDHADGYPFDGPGGILAHAFAPTDGRFHCDADELWSIGLSTRGFDLETIALHEIGHLLGLAHSSDEAAIMYPIMDQGVTKGLGPDDIQGIKALYHL